MAEYCIIEVKTEFNQCSEMKSHCGKTTVYSSKEDVEKALDELLAKFNNDGAWFVFCPGWMVEATHSAVMNDGYGEYWGKDIELDYYVVSVSKGEFMAIEDN